MEIPFDQRIVPSAHVFFRELEGESVILDTSRERYLGLDDVGTRMWTSLCSSDSIEVAYRALAVEFDVDEQVLRNDVAELVERLVTEGLVTLSGA